MKKLLNPYRNKEGYNCFGCSPDNASGLHLEFWEDGDDVLTVWSPADTYAGWVHTLHGGIIATIMDEVASWVISRKLQAAGVTSRLEVKYRHPVSTREPQVTVRGHLAGSVRNYHTVHLTLHDSTGTLCDEGEAVYCVFPPSVARTMGFTGCHAEGEEET